MDERTPDLNGPETLTTAEVERLRFYAVQYMTKEMAQVFAMQPKVDVRLDDVLGMMVFRVRQDIMAQHLEDWPADWWQAFKERWFPAWALRRWPVKVKQVWALYPKLILPQQPHTFTFAVGREKT